MEQYDKEQINEIMNEIKHNRLIFFCDLEINKLCNITLYSKGAEISQNRKYIIFNCETSELNLVGEESISGLFKLSLPIKSFLTNLIKHKIYDINNFLKEEVHFCEIKRTKIKPKTERMKDKEKKQIKYKLIMNIK